MCGFRPKHGRLSNMAAIGFALLFAAFLSAMLAGCVSFDAADARRVQTESYSNSLSQLEAALLSHPLTLDDCLVLAMTNNYAVRKAELDRQLGRFRRDMAFSAFLPQVSATATRVDYDKDPVLNSQRFTSGGVDVGLALVMPSTWFLYDEARHGRAAADLAAGYVRQGVTLQTTAAFYDVVVQERLVAARERQVAAAKETAERIAGLAREGYARPWESDQAKLLVESREAELGVARRALDVRRGDLLRALGLSSRRRSRNWNRLRLSSCARWNRTRSWQSPTGRWSSAKTPSAAPFAISCRTSPSSGSGPSRATRS